MKRISLVLVALATLSLSSYAQDKGQKGKLVKFSNITEVTLGFQVGKTSKLSTIPGGSQGEFEVAGYKFPAPRVSTSFGALFGDLFFLGPGIAYSYQPKDDNTTFLITDLEGAQNLAQHHVSAFAHARIHFTKGRFRPYTELKGGYSHIFSEDDELTTYSKEAFTYDGIFVEPAIGFGLKLGGHAQLNISLGYQFMNVWNRSDGFTSASAFGPEVKDSYHRLLLSLGFSFF